MTCPKCAGETVVRDTSDREDSVIRKRQCKECGHRFKTVEVDEDFFKKLTERRKTAKQ